MKATDTNRGHSFRCSDPLWEYVLSSSKKYGINSSEFLRRLIQEKKKKTATEPFVPQEQYLLQKEKLQEINNLTYEMNSIGININQIVKNVNSHFYSEEEKKLLFQNQQELIALVQNYIERSK